MKVVLFGTTGQVATEVQRHVPEGVTVEAISRSRADFTSPEEVRVATLCVEADVFINAVAYTNVDLAENEVDQAYAVNAESVAAMAESAAERCIPLVHISTDYVFDGSGNRPWQPDDQPGPLGVYGASKLAGEEAIRASCARHIVLRTAWVFSSHRQNFVKTMLMHGAKRQHLRVVSDQFSGPTPAVDVAKTCLTLAAALHEGAAGGTYHYVGSPCVHWADFAREIFAQAEMPTEVEDIASENYPTPSERPKNSRLDCASLANDFGIARPDWRARLGEVLAELRA